MMEKMALSVLFGGALAMVIAFWAYLLYLLMDWFVTKIDNLSEYKKKKTHEDCMFGGSKE
jgi:hypothetical protein